MFSWFLPFSGEDFCRTFSCVFTKNGMKYLFSVQTDSSHIIAQTCNLRICDKKRRMAMSKEQMAKHYDYEMKEKVVLEEEASWGKLCSKLVSNNIYISKKS